MNVPEMRADGRKACRAMTWNKLKDCLPYIGYEIKSSRKKIDGKIQQCYYITGEWHDVELQNNQFLELVAATEEMRTGDIEAEA
jgi:hypothetical protein